MSLSLFKNLELLSKRFPALGEKICSVNPTSVQVAQTDDGGFCYVKSLDNGSYHPLSSTTPVKSATQAIASIEDRIQNGLAPAVVVGLNPGFVLETVYKYFKEYSYDKYLPRRVYVIIDSLECLYGWLKREDRTEILECESIEFYWHEEVNKIVDLCEGDETRSHLFIPVSSLPEQKIMSIIQPLADLFLERQTQEEQLFKDNCVYYEQQTDEELNQILQGKAGRKPRMLIPSHASSTVVQYSVRDIKSLFEKEGWEVEIIHMKTDLSRWRIAKCINDFKPDVYMLVNHLRTEEVNFYPPDMMFITWIQDALSYINNTVTASDWNNYVLAKSKTRDFIIGYTGQLKRHLYLSERLKYCPMITNKSIFNSSGSNLEDYECDVCFASNRSKDTTAILKEDLEPKIAKFGFSLDVLTVIHDHLWGLYNSGRACTTYWQLSNELDQIQQAHKLLTQVTDSDEKDFIIQRIFWELNDVIYRHAVLIWISEIDGIKLNLYGRGWEDHPKLSQCAKGSIEHGKELKLAYKSAKFCLHLNSMEGEHQRLEELKQTGCNTLTRSQDDEFNMLRKHFDGETLEAHEQEIYLNYKFKLLYNLNRNLEFKNSQELNMALSQALSDTKRRMEKFKGVQFFDAKETLVELLS